MEFVMAAYVRWPMNPTPSIIMPWNVFACGLFTIYVTAHVTDDILRVLYKRKRILAFFFLDGGAPYLDPPN